MIRPALVFAVLGLALSACDRLPVDPFDSQVAVTSPDLGEVLLDPDLALRFDTVSPMAGATVVVNGREVERDSVGGGFLYETTLSPGLNSLAFEITDESGRVELDTLYALHLPVRFSGPITVSSNVRRAGAAAEAFDNGRVLLSGGVGSNGLVAQTATLITVGFTQVTSTEVTLRERRTGHTATRLPDGRVLVLGGVRAPDTPDASDFVEEAEAVAGVEGTSSLISSPAIRRAGHTTRVLRYDGQTYVYVLGGVVPAGSGIAPSATYDLFEYVPGEPDRLDRLTPAGGASVAGAFDAVTGGVQTPTALQESVLYGLSEDDEPVSRRLEWGVPGTTYPFTFSARGAAPLATPRTDAAGASLASLRNGEGLVLVAGGRNTQGQALSSLEVYAATIDQTFRFPEGAVLGSPRFGHTATILSGGRILIAGGRGPSGATLFSLEILQF